MMMCLQALGHECDEDEVNKVMGARPMKGASWEQALACAQHYGCRATLTMPSTVSQLKEWTDKGVPVMIAWNPEGRDWSHASVVFDVTEEDGEVYVHVADPNIPDPEETVRKVTKGEFYSKWSEKWPNYLVRRPACAIEREITPKGRQVMASKTAARVTKKEIKENWRGGFKPRGDFWLESDGPAMILYMNSGITDYGAVTALGRNFDLEESERKGRPGNYRFTRPWHSKYPTYPVAYRITHKRASSTKTALSPVAKTILDQMGGMRRLMMMIGARDFVYGPKSIAFRWPNKQRSKGNMLKVTLRGDDTYKVEFLNVAKYNVKVVKKHEGIHAEDLVDLFERQTGWYLRMGSESRVASMHTARAKKKNKPKSMKDRMKIDTTKPKSRNKVMEEHIKRGPSGAGSHHTRDRDVAKGRSRKTKHKKDWSERAAHYPFDRTTLNEAACRLAKAHIGKQEN